jgi:hypothetical protein
MGESEIAARLAALDGDLAPLSGCASRYVRFGAAESGATVAIAPMPWQAPQAFAFRLYEPLPRDARLDFACPHFYRAILHRMNGCFAFGLALYGVPAQDGLVSRAVLRPLSIQEANRTWRAEFEGAKALFHFGDAEWSESENVGYFHSGNSIVCIRQSGAECGRWPTFAEFLNDELARVEASAHANAAAAHAWHRA